MLERGSNSAVISLLGALAMGAQRLLPALQQIYQNWANLNSWSVSIATVVQMLEQPLPQHQESVEPVHLKERVRLQNVFFRYGEEQPEVLRDVNIEIQRGERIGLIGATGSGKSTLTDILMGLLPPSKGCLLVDGIDLHDQSCAFRLLEWRASLAHVPQSIYLADSSIAENIAFGVPRQEIDMERVKSQQNKPKLQALSKAFLKAMAHLSANVAYA